jgi:hypothetical protein
MNDYFDEYDDDLRNYEPNDDYQFLEPSVGEILKVVIWSGIAVLFVVCALINLI